MSTMSILDELERLSKGASIYSFHDSSGENTVWVEFISSCQKHIPALIEVAMAASDLVGANNIGKTVDTKIAFKGAISAAFHGEALTAVINALEKLK